VDPGRCEYRVHPLQDVLVGFAPDFLGELQVALYE